MASRLSSLLVRDGLVGVKRMEKAFQRQVIYGGTLDTILLEMSIVPEERLVQYLSLATGLPPATDDEVERFDARAVKVCARGIAEAYGVAPLHYDGETLRLAVKEPVDFSRLEDLADDLGLPIQPLIVPEYRFHMIFDRAYGKPTDARFVTLAQRAVEAAPVTPVGKAATVIIAQPAGDPDAPDTAIVDVDLPPSLGAAPELDPPAPIHHAPTAPIEPRREAVRTKPPGAKTDEIPAVRDPRELEDAASDDHRPQLDARPLQPAAARELLHSAADRDAIFMTLLRAMRTKAYYAGVLTVQGGACIGRTALAGAEVDDQMATVLIPLDVPSAFKQVVSSGSPYIGPLTTDDAAIARMIERMGTARGSPAAMLPIALRDRVVAIVLGHRGGDAMDVADISELLPLASAAAEGMVRLIVQAKRAGYRPALDDQSGPVAAPAIDVAAVPGKSGGGNGEGAWAVPSPAPGDDAEVVPYVDFAVSQEPPAREGDIASLLDAIENDEDDDGSAAAAVLRRADEAAPAIAARFPGKLTLDRYELGGRALRAERHGALLALVVKLGGAVAPMLIEKMHDADRDVRYYATLCAAELRPRSALRELVERLFDTDFGVRSAAVEALLGYPPRDLEASLESARRALHAKDAVRVQAAARALGELADVKAIPDLLDALGRGDAAADAIRHALRHLTKQDHGTSVRKWRAWWGKHKDRHRIEWLIDGLAHKDANLRASAVEDLRTLSGEYFGYHHDLPKKEREQTRKRWQLWWAETGRRRFLREGDPV